MRPVFIPHTERTARIYRRAVAALGAVLLVLCVTSQAQAQDNGLNGAEERAKAARDDLEAFSARLESIQAQFHDNDRLLQAAQRRAGEANARFQHARYYLNLQAASLVRSGGASVFESLLDDDAQQVAERIEFVDVVVNRQVDWVDETNQARTIYEDVIKEIQDRSAKQKVLLAQLKKEREGLEDKFRAARQDYLENGGLANADGLEGIAAVLGGLACPVEYPYTFINSWGFARSGGRHHKGTDIMAPLGATIFAYADGTVTKASSVDSGLAGRQIMIKHPGGVETWYFHLDTVKVRTGQEVRTGQVLGTNGSSGNATVGGEHLHWEYHIGGAAVNPYPFAAKVCTGR
jgi:murein DD-endopeptidase MepM/ murein hydrolase activator NlpD